MSSNLDSIRNNIQTQGSCGLDDKSYAQINSPLRLSPAIRMTSAAVGTALASPAILWVLALWPGHPFDVFYNHALRHMQGKPALPPYGARRHFACAMATVMIVVAALGFQAGRPCQVRSSAGRGRLRERRHGVLRAVFHGAHGARQGGLRVEPAAERPVASCSAASLTIPMQDPLQVWL